MTRPLLLLMATIACRPVATLDGDIPDGVDRIALLTFDEDTLIASTPLLPFDRSRGLPVERAAEGRAVLVGFSRTTLPENDVLLQAGLRTPAPCDTPVPAPQWSQEWIEDRLVPFEAPPLALLPDETACGSVEPRVEAGCLMQRCTAEITTRQGCRQALDLSACGLGAPTVRTGNGGPLCVEAQGASAPACPFVVHGAPAPLPIEIERVALHPAPVDLHTREDLDSVIGLTEGWVVDHCVQSDRITAIIDLENPIFCDRNRPTRGLVEVDPETLEVQRRIELPRCAEAMAEDPTDGTLLIASRDDAGFHLARFDPSTGTSTSTALGLTDAPLYAHEMTVFPAVNRIALLISSRTDNPDEARLLLINLQTLALAENVALSDRAFAAHAWSERELVLTHGRTFLVTRRDVVTGAETARVRVEEEPDLGRNLLGVAVVDDRIFTTAFDRLYEVDATGEVITTLDYATGGWGYVMNADPQSETLLVFGAEPNADTARVDTAIYRYDPREARVLPQVTRLPTGAPNRARRGPDGTLWLSLPWTGELARIR